MSSSWEAGVRQQLVLLILVGVICAIYIWQVVAGNEAYDPYMAIPGAIKDAWDEMRHSGFDWWQMSTFGTMISCAFLHAGPGHLIFNMLVLWIFAGLMVQLLGSRFMLVTFLFTAFTGSLCHTALNPNDYIPSLGASGAAMGFMGAYLGMSVRWQLPDPEIFPIAHPIAPMRLAILATVLVMMDWMAIMRHADANVAFGAHVGGFMGGLFLTSFIARKPAEALAR